MASLNKVLLAGNLTRDPESRQTPNGRCLCQFGLAMNRKFRNAAGETVDDVCFVDITVWGKQAEACSQYLSKGRLVMIEGRLKFDQWQDEASGQNRTRLSVVAEQVQFLPDSKGRQAGQTSDTESGIDTMPF